MNDRGLEAGNALMCGSGARLKAAPKAKPSPGFPPNPLGWLAV